MAIVFNCPLCNHPYKLKDELAGKRATCKNPDCRQVIQIPAANSNGLRIADLGGILPEDAGRDDTPMPSNPADLEAAALRALSDNAQEQEEAAAEKAIPVVCPHCDHKWMEPFEKAGKNTLCPNEECRQRVKVPMPKKGDAPADWRTGGVNKPSLAKENFEKPADVISSEAKVVTKTAWVGGGGAEQELEPHSIRHRLFVYTLIGAPVLAIAFGIWFFVTWRGERGEELTMEKPLSEFASSRDELAPAEAPIFAAILESSAAEFHLFPKKQDKEKALAQAVQHLTKARSELQQAAQKDDRKTTGAERYAVAGELALVTLGLGGTDEQAKDGQRYQWVPSAPGGQLRVNQRIRSVHEELRTCLASVKEADFDTKAVLARRLARDLMKKGQPSLALTIPSFLFSESEMPEAKAIVALEVFRLDRGSGDVKQVAEELKAQLAKGAAGRSPLPASAQTLWVVLGTEKAPTLVAPPSAQQLSDSSRLAYVGMHLLSTDNKQPEALDLVRRGGGTLTWQLRALTLYAEWAPDPSPAFDSAVSAVNTNAKNPTKDAISGSLLLRLSQLAAATGRMDQSRQLADLIPDEGQRIWAKGSAIQFSATSENKNKVEDSALEVPDSDPKKLRAGHAWGRLWQARQNTRVGGGDTKSIASWPKGTIQPFGLAGIALGQHDR
jgi:hypothetical protein